MFFRRKKKDDLTPRQQEIRARVEHRLSNALTRGIRNMFAAGAAAEMGLTLAIDLTLTGGAATAYMVVGSSVSALMAGGAYWTHRDYKRDVLKETLYLSELEEKARKDEAAPSPTALSPASRALMRLSADHFQPPVSAADAEPKPEIPEAGTKPKPDEPSCPMK